MEFDLPEAAELTTRQLNKFSRAINRFKDPAIDNYVKAPLTDSCSVAIKSAITAEWVKTDIKVKEVEDFPPGEIVKVGSEIILLFAEAQNMAAVSKN